MEMDFMRGANVRIYGWPASDDMKSPSVLICASSGGISADFGTFTPDEARKLAGMLIAAADKADGAGLSAEMLDALGAV